MLFINMFVATIMIVMTFLIHFVGLVGLSAMLRRRGVHPVNLTTTLGQGAAIMTIVFSLFALHAIEIWLYTFAYLALGAFGDIETAVYYSIASFTTVGFGDTVPDEQWRILGATEAAGGFLLIGWSTAFLVAVSARVRAFEARIEEKLED